MTRFSDRWKAGRMARRSFFHTLWRVGWRCGVLLLLCASLMLTLVMTVSTTMVKLTAEGIVVTDALSPDTDYDCILVLGAGVRDDGTPSDMLYDRVSVSAKVYAALGDTPLLMSGDHTGDYNEVTVMKSLAVELGASSEDVFLDHAGYSTFESIYRAKEKFGAKRIIIITQEYHLHRALHIARELGMDAVGVSADLRNYRNQPHYDAREVLARFKDLFVAAKGEYEGSVGDAVNLNGNGDQT